MAKIPTSSSWSAQPGRGAGGLAIAAAASAIADSAGGARGSSSRLASGTNTVPRPSSPSTTAPACNTIAMMPTIATISEDCG